MGVPTYSRINWVDKLTALGPSNLNPMDLGIKNNNDFIKLLELAGKLITLTWDNSAKIYKTNNGFTFEGSAILAFEGTSDDPDEEVEFSFDDGVTKYPLYKKGQSVKVLVQEVQDQWYTAFRQGLNGVINVEEPRTKSLPYQASHIQWRIPMNNVETAITGKTVSPPDAMNGRTLEWLVNNPYYRFGTDDWVASNIGVPTVTDGIYSFTATVQTGRVYQSLGTHKANTKIYYIARYKTSSNNIWLDGDNIDNQYSVKHSGSGEYELISRIVNVTSDGAVQIIIVDTNASGWTQVDVDYIIAIPLPDDITTEEEMEDLLDGYIRDAGNWAVGEAIELVQGLDNRYKYGNWNLGSGIAVDEETSQDEVPYLKFDEINKTAYSSETLEAETKYTMLTHIIKNTNVASNEIYLAYNLGSAWNNSILITDETGLRIDVITTNVTGGKHSVRVAGGATAGTEFILRQIILDGDQTALLATMEDEEILNLIKYEEFGTFDVIGVRQKSNAENQFDITNQLLYREGATQNAKVEENKIILFSAGTTNASGIAVKVLPNTTYTAKTFDYNVANTVFKVYTYDSEPEFAFDTSVVQNLTGDSNYEIEFTTTTETWVVVGMYTAGLSIGDYVGDIVLKIGSAPTIYEEYEESFVKITPPTRYGLQGFAFDSGGDLISDTLTEQQYGVYVLTEDDIVSIDNTTYINDIVVTKINILPLAIEWTNDIQNVTLVDDHFEIGNIVADYNDTSNAGGYATTSPASGFAASAIVFTSLAGTYASLALAKTALAGTVIRYLLATYLPRNAVNENEVEVQGQNLVSPAGTCITFANGVLPKWYQTSAQNYPGMIDILVDAIIKLVADVLSLGSSYEDLVRRIISLEAFFVDTDENPAIDLSGFEKGTYAIDARLKSGASSNSNASVTGYSGRSIALNDVALAITNAYIGISNSNNVVLTKSLLIVKEDRHAIISELVATTILDADIDKYQSIKADLLLENLPAGYDIRLSKL